MKNFYIERDKKLKFQTKDFIKEIVAEDPDWVADRRVEYLREKVAPLNKEIEFWEIKKKLYGGWFGKCIGNVCINKFEKQKKKLEKEISLYLNPVRIEYKENINDDDIEKARTADCGQFLDVRKVSGNRSWAICPLHNDKHPSLLCYPDGNGWYCFSCNVGGDAITLVEKLYNLNFWEAVKFINSQ